MLLSLFICVCCYLLFVLIWCLRFSVLCFVLFVKVCLIVLE